MLKTHPDLLAALFSGHAKVLVAAEFADRIAAAADQALDVWRLEADGAGGMLMTKPDAEGEPVDVATPPPACLAVVLPKGADATRLRTWWHAAAGQPAPEVVAARSPAEALPVVLQAAGRALARTTRRAFELETALARTRRDYELTRETVAGLTGTLSCRAPARPTLAFERQPTGQGHHAATGAGGLDLYQAIDLPAQNLAAVAVHLAEVPHGGRVRLQARLLAVESGRVLGGWHVVGADLQPGWLVFDLPQPVGPIRESVALHLKATGEDLDELALSLGPVDPDEEGLVRDAVLGRLSQTLALRVWTAAAGSRFILPAHFDWSVVDRVMQPSGAILTLPAAALDGAVAFDGADSVAREGDEARLFAVLTPGRRASVLVPDLDLALADLVLVDLRAVMPEGAALETGAWLVPNDLQVGSLADLEAAGAKAVFSGWKRPPAVGELAIGLPVPPTMLGRCSLVLAAGRGEGGEARPAVVEWRSIRLVTQPRGAGGEGTVPDAAVATLQAAAARAALDVHPPVAEALAYPALLLLDGVDLTEVRRVSASYEHLGLVLRNLRFGTRRWAQFRFKLARRGRHPALEFRPQAEGPFRVWPAGEADDHGPVFRLLLDPAQAGDLEEALAKLDPEDRRLVSELIHDLPRLVRELQPGRIGQEIDLAAWIKLVEGLHALPDQLGYTDAA